MCAHAGRLGSGSCREAVTFHFTSLHFTVCFVNAFRQLTDSFDTTCPAHGGTSEPTFTTYNAHDAGDDRRSDRKKCHTQT